MENQVDAAVDRATCVRTLTVSEGVMQVVFHRSGKSVDKRSGTQSQQIVNSAEVIVHLVGHAKIGRSSVKTVRRA